MSKLIRTTHRWLGIALVVLTLANVVAYSVGQPMDWLTYLPLLPLFLLMATGLYMFVLPYLRSLRSA
ncbi:MAG: hypothetical protein WDN31_11670 [Hyphomicrobium sp.]